jgi:hypothetical protein
MQVPVFSKSVPITKFPNKKQDGEQNEAAALEPEHASATPETASVAATNSVPRSMHPSVDLEEMQRLEELNKKDQDWLSFFLGVGHGGANPSNSSAYASADFAASAEDLSNTQVFADEVNRAAIGVNSTCTALVPWNQSASFANEVPASEASVYEEKASGAPSQSLSELISSLFESAVSSTATELTSSAADPLTRASSPSAQSEKPAVSPELLSSLQATVCAAAAELAKTSGANMTFDESNKASLAVTLPDMLADLPRAKQSLPNPALASGPRSLNDIFNEMISDDKVFKRVCS